MSILGQDQKPNTPEEPKVETRPILAPRRILEQQTTLKDIYATFFTCGPEWTLQELSRFKKNPRYLEFAAHVLEWAFSRESFEHVVRFSNEIEDWLDKRAQTFGKWEDVLGPGEGYKEILIKRKKRNLFALDKHALMVACKGIPRF